MLMKDWEVFVHAVLKVMFLYFLAGDHVGK